MTYSPIQHSPTRSTQIFCHLLVDFHHPRSLEQSLLPNRYVAALRPLLNRYVAGGSFAHCQREVVLQSGPRICILWQWKGQLHHPTGVANQRHWQALGRSALLSYWGRVVHAPGCKTVTDSLDIVARTWRGRLTRAEARASLAMVEACSR